MNSPGSTGQQVTILDAPGTTATRPTSTYSTISRIVIRLARHHGRLQPRPVRRLVSDAQLRTAATTAVGERARVVELEREPAGQVAWEASVIAADGTEYTVLLSAAGDVLDVRQS